MGKRKQKVRWCSVDTGIKWSMSDQVDDCLEVNTGVTKSDVGSSSVGGTRRSSAQGWASSLGPRFERKAAAEAEQKNIYYEGEFCEAEDLPNGFTKIRSKNLDILFKRDYYEQRLAVQQKISEELMKLKNCEIKDSNRSFNEDHEEQSDFESNQPEIKENIMGSTAGSDSTAKSWPWSFDKINPNDIPEFKPSNSVIEPSSENIDSGRTSPFYINHLPQEYEASPHPNLYLYSPSNNSLIPCKEIIIPNPVMSAEGPVYPGPTNIYLTYPVQGPDGKGYITQPFATPGSAGSYLSQDSASYSPSISNDGSSYYPSTPHTPNSGEDSGSSTQPTSPPPLDNFHPNTWTRDTHQLPSNTEGYYDPQPMEMAEDKQNINPLKSVLTKQSASPESHHSSKPTVPYIPGLALDSMSTMPKKTLKRRKKKMKTESSLSNCESANKESSSFYELGDFQANYAQREETKEIISNAHVEPIHEILLTDDLADSLVNPPTDPEASDEEDTQQSIVKHKEAIIKQENREENANEFFTETHVADNLDDELNEMEIKHEEICQISEKTKETISVKDGLDNNNFLLDHNLEKSNISSENKAEETQEYNENVMDDVNLPEVSVISSVGQNKKFDSKITVEGAINEEECEIGQNKVQPNGEDTKHSGKSNIKKSKKSKKAQTICVITESEFSRIQNPKLHQNKDSITETKKSFSSVIKSSLVKESKPTPPISTPPKVDTDPSPTPLPSNPTCTAELIKAEQDSDNWEKVPLSVSKPGNWEKTSKKRKRKKVKFEDSTQELPELEVIVKNEKCSPLKEVTKMIEKEDVRQEENSKEDYIEHKVKNVKEDDIEKEKKKLRRRKKKHDSEDPEESNIGHRIVICDDQIDIQHTRSVKRASEVFPNSLLNSVKTSGYCDFLMVNELGLGISRGCMDFGRLYQGKYIPPERIDGLLQECEEEEIVNEEAASEEVIDEDSCVTASADIDLD